MEPKKREITSIQVRIGLDLYGRISALASDNHRKVRQQVEMMLEQSLERMTQPAQLETRKGARRGS